MGNNYYLNYYGQLTKLLPRYCYVSFSQDKDILGDITCSVLIRAATELFLTGMVTQTVNEVGGDKSDQDMLHDILEDFLQLYTNTNLLIMFCHRVEILNKLANSQELVERSTLNQLNRLYEKVRVKLPFSIVPMTPLKKLKIRAGIKAMESTDSGDKLPIQTLVDIDLSEVRQKLNSIRIR